MASAGGFVYVSLPALQADAAGCGPGARSARNANARRQRSAVGISLPLPSHRSSSIVVLLSASALPSQHRGMFAGGQAYQCFAASARQGCRRGWRRFRFSRQVDAGVALATTGAHHRSMSIALRRLPRTSRVGAGPPRQRRSALEGGPSPDPRTPHGAPGARAYAVLVPRRRPSRARGREAWPRSECWAGSAFSHFPARESHAPSRRAAAWRCSAAVSATLWPTGHAGTGSAHCAFGFSSGIAPRRLAPALCGPGARGGTCDRRLWTRSDAE